MSNETIDVEIWSDIACPWCYIGKTRFSAALEQFPDKDRVRVTWRAYQLAPDTPVGAGRRELDALVAGKGMQPEQVRQMFEQVAGNAASAGLQLNFDTAIAANTFDAHRLIHLAGDRRDAVVDALFRAHFTEGKAVDDREVLLDIAESAGLDRDAVNAQLDSEAAVADVRADLQAARDLQVTGVPFFVVDRRLAVSGAQPEDVFRQLLEQGAQLPEQGSPAE
ncbi:Predicted dithiol-disulfide isomerase, DsbA family [Rhodococcus triatomae]|uniref:Predicted dithiol-disulfide isomerase, DsbA family n=1 Tax=Rhodococcus triatomae TaxID=300028 RepID=A0A1G8RWM2_9NOCA|nr:DsbA family oxidoreductase [Rhodococcus triatomae]SDJ21336.1 Predicted dithiol-disulfide isomerase, DsbA family [Rhodococcus triatomae]